ncbi:MAG: hypothetical protein GY788_03815, partial [bacterium]|nr:hypothetical protein [bacterium]
IVVYKSKPGNSEKNRVEALGGEIKRSYGKLKMRTMSVPAKRLKSLANDLNIEYITLDEPVSALSMAARKTANLPEQAAANGIYDGSGVTVAVLDSGVDDHPDLNLSAQIDIIAPPANCSFSVRDEFNGAVFTANDGTSTWAGDWLEDDAAGSGASSGNVTISGGELLLDDRPNTGTEPSATRSVDLSEVTAATLSFNFRTGSGVEAYEDRVALDVSGDGGATYTT